MSAMQVDYNAVASFERSKEPERKAASSRVFTTLLLAVFFVVMMTGLAAGAAMYQSIANNQIDTNMARMQSGLLASNIRTSDVANSLGMGNGPEGHSLVLTEKNADGRAFEMRIYLYEGQIVQEYSAAGSAYSPGRAQPLIDSKTFDFQMYGDLLVIRTDQGATNIALRSYQGGDE